MTEHLQKIKNIDLAYIAGFLDGDGAIIAQIVKGDNYKYKYRIRLSIVFYQHKKKHWFMLWLKEQLKYGYVRLRKDGMSEYVITSSSPVEHILILLKPYLRLKHDLCNLVLKIIKNKKDIKSKKDFIDLCKLVDLTQELNYSKRRSITTSVVEDTLKNLE